MEETFVPFRGIKNDLHGRLLCYKQDWSSGIKAGFRYGLFTCCTIERTNFYKHFLNSFWTNFQDLGTHYIHFLCLSNSSDFIWRAAGEKYRYFHLSKNNTINRLTLRLSNVGLVYACSLV